MAEHLSESHMLALAAGEQPDAAAREHLAECAICAEKLKGYRATWTVLGRWQEPTELNQPDDAWQQELQHRLDSQRSFTYRVLPILLRVAAMVLVAAGLGIGAAWVTAPADDPSQLAAHALYLDSLSANRSLTLESTLILPTGAEVQP